ncbi:hypothetical protein QEV69_00660 [Trueperella pyogenes]|uniref:AAA family ATPase n=1 Tax=Trueperella pyogenes TaxID=1661 RepID=UPI00324C5FC0
MILLCLPGHLDEQVVRGLAAFGEERQIARRCADIAEVLAAVEANLGRVVLLWGDDPSLDLSLVTRLRKAGVRVGVVPGSRPISDIHAFGALPVSQAKMVEFVRDTKPEMLPDTPANRGTIIAVWGPGGSVGRSALVRDLAALAPNVVVVDADSHRPCLTQLYGVEETSAIVALARHIERGKDPMEMIDSVLVELPGRASARPGRLLAGLNTGERWRELPRVVVERMWEPLAACADTVIVDLSGGMESRPTREDRHAVARSALEAADIVVHVGAGTPIGLRRFLEHLDAVGTDRAGEQHGVVVLPEHGLGIDGRAKVAAILADAPMPYHFVRQDRRRIEQCELHCQAVTTAYPRSGYAKDVRALWGKISRR